LNQNEEAMPALAQAEQATHPDIWSMFVKYFAVLGGLGIKPL
jgi:hypothetical protein